MAAPAFSNLVSTYLNSQYGNVSQDAQGNWISTTTGGGGEGGPGPDQVTPLQNLMTPDDWAKFQAEMKSGVLQFTPGSTQQSGGSGGPTSAQVSSLFNVDESKLPKNVFGGAGNLGLVSGGFNDPNKKPTQDQWGAITDRSQLKWDPNYGWVTPFTNITHDKEPWYEKAMDFVGNYTPAAIGVLGSIMLGQPELLFGDVAAGLGLTSAIGSAGSTAFNVGGKALINAGNDGLPTTGGGQATTATPNAQQQQGLLQLLQILGLLKGG